MSYGHYVPDPRARTQKVSVVSAVLKAISAVKSRFFPVAIPVVINKQPQPSRSN